MKAIDVITKVYVGAMMLGVAYGVTFIVYKIIVGQVSYMYI
jgi:hypothetical protein